MSAVIDEIQIIDADTHLVEPPDLWTPRLPSRFGDLIPHVKWDPDQQEEAWFVGDQRMAPVASAAQAGWPEFPPDHPRRWSDADPATWDPKLRLGRMDQYGIHAQVLYPNVALFNSALLQDVAEGLPLAFMQAYNNYQTDFASVAPARYLPMTSLPFWDLDATLTETDRCTAAGHKGIVFSQDPSAFRL